MFMPILFALLIGTEELARVTYTYYMLQKTLSRSRALSGHAAGRQFLQRGRSHLTAADQQHFDRYGRCVRALPLIAGLTPDDGAGCDRAV